MIRITTNSSLRMYRSNLMKSTNSLNSAMTKLMTQRQFSSYASNPAAATRAFKIHSSLNATNAQYSNNDSVLHKYETAWSTLESVLDGYDGLVQDTGRVPAQETKPTAAQRPGAAPALSPEADSREKRRHEYGKHPHEPAPV